jgi:hypothetical protein
MMIWSKVDYRENETRVRWRWWNGENLGRWMYCVWDGMRWDEVYDDGLIVVFVLLLLTINKRVEKTTSVRVCEWKWEFKLERDFLEKIQREEFEK